MPLTFTRRNFVTASTTSLLAMLPKGVFSETAAEERVLVRTGSEIGTVRPELHGHFAEHLGSCVYGGLWVGTDSKIPNVNGYRKAAVDYLVELGIPALRWPGGCFADDYHWREGIGPASKRPKRVNIHWGNYIEDNSFGVHEFIGLCRAIGAEPYLAANMGSGTPQEVRDWVEYCNFPSGSALSDERIANGSREPFRVKYWGIGNENWGCGGSMTPDHYADLYRQFANFVRPFGETRPFLIACGPNSNNTRWSRRFLDGMAGARMPDGFAMHYYENGTMYPTRFTPEAAATQLSMFQKVEQAIVQQRALLDSYDPQRRVGLLLDEWGVWDRLDRDEEQRKGRLYQQSTIRSAVAAGLGLNIFNRHADKLYMCNIAQIVNVLQSLLLTDEPYGQRCIRTTTYYAFMLFKAHRAKTAVAVESGGSGPLDLSVSASKSGADLIVTFVNPRDDRDLHVECSLAGAGVRSATAQILHHSDLNAANTFDRPDAVVPREHPVQAEGSHLKLDAPAMSVITATVRMA